MSTDFIVGLVIGGISCAICCAFVGLGLAIQDQVRKSAAKPAAKAAAPAPDPVHYPGTKENPHIITSEPKRFMRPFGFEEDTLTLATAWRQNNCDGRTEWVLIHLEPETFARQQQFWTSGKRSAKFLIDDFNHITYLLRATAAQEKADWQREIKEGRIR